MNDRSRRRWGSWLALVVLMGPIYGCQSQQPALEQLAGENTKLQQQNANLNQELSDIQAELRATKTDAMVTIDNMVNLFAAAKRANRLTKQLAVIERKARESEAEATRAQTAAATADEDAKKARAQADWAMADAKQARTEANQARTEANTALAELRQQNEKLKTRVAESDLVQAQRIQQANVPTDTAN